MDTLPKGIETAAAATEAVPWPWWAVWLLWIPVVAACVMALAEWPKRLWFKPSRVWKEAGRTRDKVMLLAPLLGLLGAGIGGPVYLAAAMLDTPLLAFMLGAGTGILAAPIYDATLGVIALVPKVFRKKAGLDETTVVPTIDADLPSASDDPDAIPTFDGSADPYAPLDLDAPLDGES